MHGVICFLDAQPATSSMGNLIHFIFLAVIWELWCSRNRSRYDSIAMTSSHVLSKIRLNVQDAVSASLLVFKGLASAQIRIFSQWGIHVQQSPNLIPKVVRWLLPPTGRLKLNVDGAFKSSMGTAGGGGVLRNDRGDIIFCFAHRCPHVCSSLESEALALTDGIYLCCNHGMVLMLERMSRGVRIWMSSRSQHHRVLQFFLHHRLWIMVCLCKAWCRLCRLRRTLRLHSRLSWRLRLRLQLQFPKSMAMVVLPSWSDSRGWLHPLLRWRVSHYWRRAG
ncbi:hypothetical protein Taro_042471 [Colocasia esculenta]|uniref:RNase H type-1 domain-containing protein n=1 Tax=Colocasia esculenta TaxID=4460 RepID=A0A843WPP3_COLES|nr:hypothetical protein [Colocasia esculenta]